ncbi:hypothetical protein [Mucisphaera sp.]|uniref:hypothetical protein n=1 Tax=Mucisphaera sp. TaxID=2913024 RepID=UPI003D0BACDE
MRLQWLGMPLVLVVLMASLGGCGGQPVYVYSDEGVLLPKQAGSGLVPRLEDAWLIPDVPMPIGFQPVTSQCFSKTDGVMRTVTHVYQGRTHTSDAVKFYRQNLRDPELGWVFEGIGRTEDGVQILDYTKGPEAMQIRIVTELGLTTVQIDITPREFAVGV